MDLITKINELKESIIETNQLVDELISSLAANQLRAENKETKVLQSIAERKQMQRVIDGEIAMVNTVKTHQAIDLKDEIVLIIISIPLLICAWGIFSDDPEIITKLDSFFDQVNKFPLWLQGLIIGGYSSVLGIKGVSAFKKK